jgi:hypothetical protein
MPISYFDSYGDDVDAHGALSFDPWKPKDIAIAKVIGDVWLASLVQWVTGRASAADVSKSIDVAVRLLLRDWARAPGRPAPIRVAAWRCRRRRTRRRGSRLRRWPGTRRPASRAPTRLGRPCCRLSPSSPRS